LRLTIARASAGVFFVAKEARRKPLSAPSLQDSAAILLGCAVCFRDRIRGILAASVFSDVPIEYLIKFVSKLLGFYFFPIAEARYQNSAARRALA
jgi:hypothetical protein